MIKLVEFAEYLVLNMMTFLIIGIAVDLMGITKTLICLFIPVVLAACILSLVGAWAGIYYLKKWIKNRKNN